jgi:hypothetical protein
MEPPSPQDALVQTAWAAHRPQPAGGRRRDAETAGRCRGRGPRGSRRGSGAINPRVIFVDALAGIPGLVASQVQQAFAPAARTPAGHPPTLPATVRSG